jgi:hypothetical protein
MPIISYLYFWELRTLCVSPVKAPNAGLAALVGLPVSGVMCSASVCEHYWSIEGWIHSQRRNNVNLKLVEKLVRKHTNLVLRESLHDTL